MNKKCLFCQKKCVGQIFRATENPTHKEAYEFACTNCGFGVHGPIVKCGNCGIVYVDEEITQSEISTYYEIAEDPLYLEEQHARQKTFTNYLNRLEQIYPKKGKLLDVGTNTGLFVYLADKRGWKAAGLEPNRWGVNYAKKTYGLKLINKTFDKGVFDKESFEVITMWDVIEHFTDPIKEMEKVFWYLKPGGVFAYSTVDPDSPLARIMGTKWPWYMEMHRTFLSRKSSEYYLKKSGFNRVIFKSHFRNLSLGYLSTRLSALHPSLARLSGSLISELNLGKVVVPYYANDLYDCYAFKD